VYHVLVDTYRWRHEDWVDWTLSTLLHQMFGRESTARQGWRCSGSATPFRFTAARACRAGRRSSVGPPIGLGHTTGEDPDELRGAPGSSSTTDDRDCVGVTACDAKDRETGRTAPRWVPFATPCCAPAGPTLHRSPARLWTGRGASRGGVR
jgi:hypothetical protein